MRSLKLKLGGLWVTFLIIASNWTLAGDLLLDDFSDVSNLNWSVTSGTWTFDSGRLSGTGAGGGVDAYIYAGSTNWTDCFFETRVYFGTGNAILNFRSTGHWQNEYRWILWASNSPQYANTIQLQKFQDGVGAEMIADILAQNISISSSSVLARVEARGNSIKLFINGQQIAQYTDSNPLTKGQVGLGVIWAWNAQFDDVKVTEPYSGMEVYLSFDGTMSDLTGNGHDAVPSNHAQLGTDRFGNSNSACIFDGADDYLTLATTVDFKGAEGRTVMFWTKLNETFVPGDPQQVQPAQEWLKKVEMGVENIHSGLGVNGEFFYMHDPYWNVTNTASPVTAPMNWAAGVWYHFAIVYDATNTVLYVNGVVSGGGGGYGGGDSLAPTYLGCSLIEGLFLNGAMDEFMVFNRKLTDGEIRTEVAEQSPPNYVVAGNPIAHGEPLPYGYGSRFVFTGTILTNSVTSPVPDAAGVRHICTGWTGSGDVPSSGTGAVVVVTATTSSTLTWQWATEYSLTASAGAEGSVTASNGWYAAGSTVSITATASSGYHFLQWTGDVPDGMTTNNPLLVSMSSAKTITAIFAEDSAALHTLVFWNKLGSQYEIEHSEVGPDGVIVGGGFTNGVFGNAYVARYDQDRMVEFPASIIPAGAGCVEFWARMEGMPESIAWGENPSMFSTWDGYGNEYQLSLNGNDGDSGGGLYGSAGSAERVTTGEYGTWSYSSILGSGQEATWHHYALVWDQDGIDLGSNGAHKVAAYVDGVLNTGRWHAWRDVPVTFNTPTSTVKVLSSYLSQGIAMMDNLKIWNYAKTNFLDRFMEGQPDFIVTGISLEPEVPRFGGTFTANVTVENRGKSGNAGYLYVYGNMPTNVAVNATPTAYVYVGNIATGESRTVTLANIPSSLEGQKTFRAFIDARNATIEASESNNQAVVSYVVRKKPDLVVSSITFDPLVPSPGTNFNAYVVIKNMGASVATNFYTSVWTDMPADATNNSSAGANVFVGRLDVGQSATNVFYGLSGGGSTGVVRTFRAFVDGSLSVDEINENNNQLIKVYRSLVHADFAVTGIAFDPPRPLSGKLFTAYVTVTNKGVAAGNAGYLCVWANRPAQVPVRTVGFDGRIYVGTLQAGQSKRIALTALKGGLSDVKVFRAFIDATGLTVETDEANNQMVSGYDVIDKPDLLVSAVALSPSVPSRGGSFSASVTVRNVGSGTASNVLASLWEDSPAVPANNTGASANLSMGTILPGQFAIRAFTGLYAGTGSVARIFRAFADSDLSVDEISEANNQATLRYTPASRPDFVITDITLSTTNPPVGGSFSVDVFLKNVGYISGNAGYVDVWANNATNVVPGLYLRGDKYQYAGTLNTNGTKTLTFTGLLAGTNSTPRTFRAVVDSRGTTAEISETNNQEKVDYIPAD